jgi:arylsulfatase A-like enzyme
MPATRISQRFSSVWATGAPFLRCPKVRFNVPRVFLPIWVLIGDGGERTSKTPRPTWAIWPVMTFACLIRHSLGQTAQDTPFLLTMITSVAHDPFVLPSWYGETPKDRPAAYAKAVEYTDAFVGEVLNRLDALSLTGDTIVCVLGDHGESLRPETKRGRWIPYEEVIRVPWLMRWPGRLAGGQRISWPCSQMDVTPTILRVLGCDIGEAGFDGRDALQTRPTGPQAFLFVLVRGQSGRIPARTTQNRILAIHRAAGTVRLRRRSW